MALSRTGKPNVKVLARRREVDALVGATTYQDLTPGAVGGVLDRGAQVRSEAVLALGELGPDVGGDAVKKALSDPADSVRVAAIRVLHAREDAVALSTALAWLPVDQGRSRALAKESLLDLCRPECAPSLIGALIHSPGDAPLGDEELELLTAVLGAGVGTDIPYGVVEQLLVALADEQDQVADRAEELLALIAPVSTEGVIAELKAGAAPHRAAAVLADIKDLRALDPLIEGLRNRDVRVRAECAGALGELRHPDAVEPLLEATRDLEHRVRSQAVWALDQLGTVAIVIGVTSMLRPVIGEATVNGASVPAIIDPAELERLLAWPDESE